MAKQWSMDEIDNLLESTQENGVSDLVAELMGDSAEAPQAEPVEEKTLPVPEEEDDFDDDYDYDYDDFDEDEGPDVEGVDDLFGDPVSVRRCHCEADGINYAKEGCQQHKNGKHGGKEEFHSGFFHFVSSFTASRTRLRISAGPKGKYR